MSCVKRRQFCTFLKVLMATYIFVALPQSIHLLGTGTMHNEHEGDGSVRSNLSEKINFVVTSCNGNIFCVTGALWGESTGERMTHTCVNKLNIIDWDNSWLVTWSASSHYLNQCWNFVMWTWKKLQCNLNQNLYILFKKINGKISPAKLRAFFWASMGEHDCDPLLLCWLIEQLYSCHCWQSTFHIKYIKTHKYIKSYILMLKHFFI